MTVLYVLLPIAVVFAAGFLGAFIWAVRGGQLDDLETPQHRILLDDDPLPVPVKRE
ncbi:MAG: cbb3-type cytochrome oxidase assembly protein CcoS [Myxococcota bacterium]